MNDPITLAEIMESFRVGIVVGIGIGVVLTIAVRAAWRERKAPKESSWTA